MKKMFDHIATILVALVFPVAMPTPASGQATGDFDVSQAELMVELLESVNRGGVRNDLISAVMESQGTALIVGQLNLARRVSRAQYEQLLRAFVERRAPDISPLDDGVRARRGVEGLVVDVWQRLTWALDHTDLIRRRIGELGAVSVKDDARRIAMDALPEPVELTPALFAVAGGRAGAAALGDSSIYFDVVVMSLAAERHPDERQLDDELIRSFVAHEFHHLALARLHRRLGFRPTNDAERRAWEVVGALVAEGSATYLVDWSGDLESHRRDAGFVEYIEDVASWYATAERILTEVLSGRVTSDEEFAALTSVMLGNSYHATGAAMLATIDRAQGREAALAVVGDPRTLLSAFNEASATYRFSEDLAMTVAEFGRE